VIAIWHNLNSADQIAVALIVTALAPFFVYEAAGSLWRWWDARFQAGVDARIVEQRLQEAADAEWAKVRAALIAVVVDTNPVAATLVAFAVLWQARKQPTVSDLQRQISALEADLGIGGTP
jgi:hypothetical protein